MSPPSSLQEAGNPGGQQPRNSSYPHGKSGPGQSSSVYAGSQYGTYAPVTSGYSSEGPGYSGNKNSEHSNSGYGNAGANKPRFDSSVYAEVRHLDSDHDSSANGNSVHNNSGNTGISRSNPPSTGERRVIQPIYYHRPNAEYVHPNGQSRYAMVKQSWGSYRNFMHSYGLKPYNEEDHAEAKQILDKMLEYDWREYNEAKAGSRAGDSRDATSVRKNNQSDTMNQGLGHDGSLQRYDVPGSGNVHGEYRESLDYYGGSGARDRDPGLERRYGDEDEYGCVDAPGGHSATPKDPFNDGSFDDGPCDDGPFDDGSYDYDDTEDVYYDYEEGGCDYDGEGDYGDDGGDDCGYDYDYDDY